MISFNLKINPLFYLFIVLYLVIDRSKLIINLDIKTFKRTILYLFTFES
jgi:hypothetical protein